MRNSKKKPKQNKADQIRTQSKAIQSAFRKLYFEWELEHVRPMLNFVAITDQGRDTCLSRDEFVNAVLDHRYQAPSGIPVFYGRFVQTTGGFTRLTIKRPDGTSVVSKHNFHPTENFFKAYGFVKAALKAVGKEIGPILEEEKAGA
jgi:hypothetical protein